VETAATGTAELTYDPVTRVVTWTLSYSGLSGPATMAHFHGPAAPGKNGPPVIWRSPKGSPVEAPVKGEATLTPEQAQQFSAGEWYIKQPNQWGLYQVHGNVREWTEDCYNKTYTGAPNDGSAWTKGDCDRRVLRNGSWTNKPALLRSAFRGTIANSSVRSDTIGFRVARTLLSP